MELLRRSAAAQAWFAWATLSVLRATGSAAQKLPGHSIPNPPDINALASEWFLGGTVIPTQEALMLSPGVPDRAGMMWSSFPLLTNNFETTLTFKARRPATRAAKEGGFAFWYSYENGTAAHHSLAMDHMQNQDKLIAGTWREQFEKDGMTLFGYRSAYKGLGVFFVDDDQPSVSAVVNDGTRDIKLGAGIPTSDAVKFDFFSGQDVTVKIHIAPDHAKIEIPGHGNIEMKWAFQPGGYIGFTSFGGHKLTPEAEEKGAAFEVKSMEVLNRDSASKGEESHTTSPPPKPVAQEDKVDVLAEASSFKDHRAESDAIKDLTNMVFKLVVETQPMRQQMFRAIDTLGKRISAMEANFAGLKAELDKKTGHKLGVEFDNIKKELISLSNVALKESEDRHSKLEAVHADIAHVHKTAHSADNLDKHLDRLSASNTKVIDQLTNEHQRMTGVSIAAIAFIIIAGLSLYNKFRCWEKKHVL